MIKGSGKWYGDAASKVILAAGWRSIQLVTVAFWTELQSVLGVANPRPYHTPSQPGESPRKRTGFGAAGVSYELDERKMSGRVGVQDNAKYMAFLEQGTRNVAPRPWFLVTLERMLPKLRAIAARK